MTVWLQSPYFLSTPLHLHRDTVEPLNGGSFLWAEKSMTYISKDPFNTTHLKSLVVFGRLIVKMCVVLSRLESAFSYVM